MNNSDSYDSTLVSRLEKCAQEWEDCGSPFKEADEIAALCREAAAALSGPSHDLAERCKEVLSWKAVGVLKGEALRKLAATKQPEDYALRLAEAQTADEAMQFVIDSPAATPSQSECICPKCGIRHGGKSGDGSF